MTFFGTLALLFLALGFWGGPVLSLTSGGIRVSFLEITTLVFIVLFFIRYHPTKKSVYAYAHIFLPFLLIAHLSLLFASLTYPWYQIVESSLFLLRFETYTVLVLILMQRKIRYSLEALYLCGIGLSFLGILQYFLYPNLRNLSYLGWDPHEFRVFSTLLDPNFTGILLIMTLVLGRFLYEAKKMSRIKWIVSTLVVGITLLLTYSRGSFVALTAVLFVWFWKTKRLRLFLFVCLILGAILVLLPRPGGAGVDLLRTFSIFSRISDTKEGWQLFLQSPFIGHGFNTLRFARGISDRGYFMVGSGSDFHSGAGFQNSWLTLLTTTGILGLISYLWIWRLLYGQINMPNAKLFVLLSFIAVGVHSFFDNSLFFPWVMFWLWWLAGSFVTLQNK